MTPRPSAMLAVCALLLAFVLPADLLVHGRTGLRTPARRAHSARRVATRARARVAAATAAEASAPRELRSDGDYCMWSEGDVHKLRVHLKGTECTFETGRIARLAGGSVVLTTGDTVLFASACFEAGGSPADFVPLRVDYQERYSAAGKTAGGYIKRDGRAGDSEILTSRLIDRPIRPAFPKGWSQETQICSYVLSYDGSAPPDCLAVCASAAALAISDVPFEKPVACVRVSKNAEGELVLNAPPAEQAESDVNVVLAGTADALLMIEGFCKFVPEEEIVAAAEFGQEAIRHMCLALSAWQAVVGKPKATHLIREIPANVAQEVEALCGGRIEEVLSLPSKQAREAAFDALKREVEAALSASAPAAQPVEALPKTAELEAGTDEALPPPVGDADAVLPDDLPVEDALDAAGVEGDAPPHAALKRGSAPTPAPVPGAMELADVQLAFKALASRTLRSMVATKGTRPDGRGSTDVRPLAMETSVLPRTHGSALFTRGETQSLATVTLGDASSEQKFEGMLGAGSKRFYLQYSFPPFSVGEVGRVGGMPGRREVGHGNLAERALAPAMPAAGAFPYTVRVESLITMSCGSSSMASVCGGCLALMDAAVPLARPVAGVAMGLLFDEDGGENHVVLTDIIGLEDALGSMDFKVAGDKDGVTALQLDVKCEGLSIPLLRSALAQAHDGRQHILDAMAAVMAGPRESLPDNVPRICKMDINPSHCGAIIGKEGKTITSIIEESGVDNIDLSRSDGILSITAKSDAAIQTAKERIEAIVAEVSAGRDGRGPRPEVTIGDKYAGTVKSVMPFGIFVELLPGLDGFCHISELSESFIRKIEDAGLSEGDQIDVVVTNRNEKGQYRVRRVTEGDDGGGGSPAAEGGGAQPPKGAGKRGPGGGRGKRGADGGGAGEEQDKRAVAIEEAALSAALNGLADEAEA